MSRPFETLTVCKSISQRAPCFVSSALFLIVCRESWTMQDHASSTVCSESNSRAFLVWEQLQCKTIEISYRHMQAYQ
jgi:hypothetical protein